MDRAGSCFVSSHKGHITFYNFKQSIVKFQFHLYITSVGSRRAGLPYKNIIKKLVPFHFKTMIHAYIHTHILTYYGICVFMDTYMYTCWNIIKQPLKSKGDAVYFLIFFD